MSRICQKCFVFISSALATQQQIQGVQQITTTSGKPKVMDIQQQPSQQGKPSTGGQRPLNILPSLHAVQQAANIRAASNVSTQTVNAQTTVQAQVTILTLARNNHYDYFEFYGGHLTV